MRCPQCGTVNPAGNEFCVVCGSVLPKGGAGSSKLLPFLIGGGVAILLVLIAAIALLLTSNNNGSPATPDNTAVAGVPNPTTTVAPTGAATLPPTATPLDALPTITPALVKPTALTFQFSPLTIGPDQLDGAYRRNDGTLFGRQEVALYGTGSSYDQANTSFNLAGTPANPVKLSLTGLDDERAAHCHLQVLLNGGLVYDQDNTFPNAPGNDIGVGGNDRYWGQFSVTLPASAFHTGSNTLTLRNTTAWAGYLGIPYILLNSIQLGA